jgi:RNA polymerase sigma factor (sigma-70 family)
LNLFYEEGNKGIDMQNVDEIITGCINKDKHYEDLLYAHFSSVAYAICIRYAANSHDAKDIFQEAFVKVYVQIKNYNKQGSFEGWLKRIFVNTALDYCRRKKNIHFTSAIEKFETISEEEVSQNNVDIPKEKLFELIRNLPDGYRLVFNLYAIEKYSHKQIAEALNIEEGTSKSQLFKARKMLQKEIIKLQQYINH